jgi:hypothetical protein
MIQLSDPALAGPYRLPAGQEAALVEAARALGWPVQVCRPHVGDRDAWLAAVASALALPAHFGGNFDALYDCLCDPQQWQSGGCVLVLGGLDALGDDVDILIAVLQAASDELRERGFALWALLDAPHLDLDPLPRA